MSMLPFRELTENASLGEALALEHETKLGANWRRHLASLRLELGQVEPNARLDQQELLLRDAAFVQFKDKRPTRDVVDVRDAPSDARTLQLARRRDDVADAEPRFHHAALELPLSLRPCAPQNTRTEK